MKKDYKKTAIFLILVIVLSIGLPQVSQAVVPVQEVGQQLSYVLNIQILLTDIRAMICELVKLVSKEVVISQCSFSGLSGGTLGGALGGLTRSLTGKISEQLFKSVGGVMNKNPSPQETLRGEIDKSLGNIRESLMKIEAPTLKPIETFPSI